MKHFSIRFGIRHIGIAIDMGFEAGRILASGAYRKLNGHERYGGSAKQICAEVVKRCYHQKKGYFKTSLTTYTDFWARDFGRAVPALLNLGYRDEVLSSYRHAFEAYERKNRFALVITPRGNLFDFPYYAPDGFAFFLRGLTYLDAPELVARHRPFLERELRRFAKKVVDPSTGLVRSDRHYSEAQDYAKRTSSCYSNVMCHLTQQAAEALSLDHPLKGYDYKALVFEQFWNRDHFFDDMLRLPYVSGDACITPFWADMVQDAEKVFPRVLARMDREGLTEPYAARYGNTAKKNRPMIRLERFNQWQRDTVWTCLGLQLLEVLERLAPARYLLELAKLEHLVEKLECFPEVLFSTDASLFRGPFYMSDDSMLWAADLLWMLRKRDRTSHS